MLYTAVPEPPNVVISTETFPIPSGGNCTISITKNTQYIFNNKNYLQNNDYNLENSKFIFTNDFPLKEIDNECKKFIIDNCLTPRLSFYNKLKIIKDHLNINDNKYIVIHIRLNDNEILMIID